MRFHFMGTMVAAFLCAGMAGGVDGEINKTIRLGDVAPGWESLEGIDGNKHSLADLKKKDVVVVIFTCNDCVVARAYEQRIIDFTARMAKRDSRVAVVAISLFNHGERDSLDNMKKRALEHNYNFSYIIDPTQQLGKAYGATVTPDIFVLNKERKVAYLGAFDDHIDSTKVKVKYLEDAVEALLRGKTPPVLHSKPFGCPIRYVKK